jgi:catechol 2,3-dioxygenase-like lactoylglutathione lyase family enzyme
MNHIHFYLPDIPAMKSWYVQTFGGNPGRRACVRCTFATPRMIETVDMPGTNLSFSPSERRLPTLGRAVDHISFDVEDLDAVVRTLEARGITLDGRVRQLPGTTVQSVFLTDPWGTRIELTEGLAPR